MKLRVGDRVTVEVRTVGFGEPSVSACDGVILRLADDSGQYGVEIAQPYGRAYWVFKRENEMARRGPEHRRKRAVDAREAARGMVGP